MLGGELGRERPFLIPVHRFESCGPSNENFLLPVDAGMGGRIWVGQRNLHYLDGRYVRLRGLHDSVEQKGVGFAYFPARRALQFDFASIGKVTWNRFGENNTEATLTAGTGVRFIAWHGNSCIVDLCRQERRKQYSTSYSSTKSQAQIGRKG